LSTTATASSAVTTYPITVSGTPATSSNYTISYVDGTLTVTPASLTVTANDTSKQYGAANPTFTVSYGSFVNGDTPSDLGGTVTFSENGTELCTTPTLTGNSASCTYDAFSGGNHTLTATYNPSANFQTTSATLSHLVN